MAVEILMPKLGMTMEEGKLIEWSKDEKDQVAKEELLFIIESDKVTFEVESPASGILTILKEADEVFPVGTLLGYLAESEKEYEAIKKQADEQVEAAVSVDHAVTTALREARVSVPQEPLPKGKVRATPGARKLAKQKGLDITILH